MTKIEPLRITFKTVQQAGLEILLEHYCNMLMTIAYKKDLRTTVCHLILLEFLVKIKQKNILCKSSATYTLSPQLRLSLMFAREFPTPQHYLAMSVEAYLMSNNEKNITL